mgnify:CR=1 FL=1
MRIDRTVARFLIAALLVCAVLSLCLCAAEDTVSATGEALAEEAPFAFAQASSDGVRLALDHEMTLSASGDYLSDARTDDEVLLSARVAPEPPVLPEQYGALLAAYEICVTRNDSDCTGMKLKTPVTATFTPDAETAARIGTHTEQVTFWVCVGNSVCQAFASYRNGVWEAKMPTVGTLAVTVAGVNAPDPVTDTAGAPVTGQPSVGQTEHVTEDAAALIGTVTRVSRKGELPRAVVIVSAVFLAAVSCGITLWRFPDRFDSEQQ